MALGDEAAQRNTRGDRREVKPTPVPVQPSTPTEEEKTTD